MIETMLEIAQMAVFKNSQTHAGNVVFGLQVLFHRHDMFCEATVNPVSGSNKKSLAIGHLYSSIVPNLVRFLTYQSKIISLFQLQISDVLSPL